MKLYSEEELKIKLLSKISFLGCYGYQMNQVPGTSGSRPFTPPSFPGWASPYSVSMSLNNSATDSSDDPDHTYFSL